MFQAIEFRTPSVVFGMDAVLRIGKEAKRLGGHRVLVVTGPRIKGAGLPEKALSCLKAEKLAAEVIVQERDTPEPATSVVEEVTDFARQGGFDLIVGLGGGSILDVAKMASALLTNPGKTTDYFGGKGAPSRQTDDHRADKLRNRAEVTKHAIFLDRIQRERWHPPTSCRMGGWSRSPRRWVNPWRGWRRERRWTAPWRPYGI
jgi:alcohol dehydrogenase